MLDDVKLDEAVCLGFDAIDGVEFVTMQAINVFHVQQPFVQQREIRSLT